MKRVSDFIANAVLAATEDQVSEFCHSLVSAVCASKRLSRLTVLNPDHALEPPSSHGAGGTFVSFDCNLLLSEKLILCASFEVRDARFSVEVSVFRCNDSLGLGSQDFTELEGELLEFPPEAGLPQIEKRIFDSFVAHYSTVLQDVAIPEKTAVRFATQAVKTLMH